MADSPRKMELGDSIRYLEGLRSREAFARFCEWVLGADATELLERINRPITPGFGHVVG